jgi:hypothetical protein
VKRIRHETRPRTPRMKAVDPANQLTRSYLLEVYKSGEVMIRARGEPMPEGVLPVYSTDSREEAEMIQVRCCVLSRVDNQTYRLNPNLRNDGQLTLEDLPMLTEMFKQIHEQQRAAKAEAGT